MPEPSRPRPRPKPRAVAKPAAANGDGATNGTSAASTSRAPATTIDDEDAMFMRNRNRTSNNAAWQKLQKQAKAAPVLRVDSESEPEEEDDDEELSPRRKMQKRKHAPAPTRFNADRIQRLLSTGLTSDSDDDVVDILEETDTPRATRDAPSNKRVRTRPRSVTPPPVLSQQQLQGARLQMQQSLGIEPPRPPSPIEIESDDEDEEFSFTNPELAAIAKKAQLRASSQVPTTSPAPEGADTVYVSVKWKPHPLNEAGKEDLWMFKMNRDDNFRDLFDACAEEAQILTEDLIVCYNNRQIFSSVTPIALRIWEKADLVACETSTYEYLRKNPSGESNHFSLDKEPTPALQELSDDDDEPLEYAEPQEDDEDDKPDGSDTFRITIRSNGVVDDITVTVRPTTTCGAIVKAFLQKAGLQDQYPNVFNPSATAPKKSARGKAPEKDPRVCIDGDKMENDAEIGEADLEDGDQVELVGL